MPCFERGRFGCTDYPDPAGGDEIAFGGAHALTIPVGQDFTVKGNVATSGVIGASGASLIVLGTLRLDGDLYLDENTDYALGSVSAGAAHYLGGFDFGQGNDSADVTTDYTFASPLDSPNQIFLEGGTWGPFQAQAAGRRILNSIYNSGHLIVDFGATNNTGVCKLNDRVLHSSNAVFENSGVIEFRKAYDLKLNEAVFGNTDIELGTIIVNGWSTAGSTPNATIFKHLTGAVSGTKTADALVIDGRTGTRPSLITFEYPGTLNKYLSIQGGGLFNGISGNTHTITNSFLFDDENEAFGFQAKKIFDPNGKHIWFGDVNQTNSHPFDATENNTVQFHNWLIDIPASTGDGPDIFSCGSWSTGSLSVQNNVLLTAQEGALINALGAGTSVDVPVTHEHNTVVVRNQGAGFYGHLAKTEVGGAGDARWEDLTLRSNLSVMLDAVTGDTGSVSFQNPGQPNQVTTTNYNAFYNVTDRYRNVEFDPAKTEGADADFGLNDVTLSADPFIDSSRTVTSWVTGQAGLGSVSAWFDELAKYNTDNWSASYDPWTDTTGTYDWVRAGYVVIDAALNGTAHDGGVIGAMGYQAQSAGGSGSVGLSTGMIGGIGKLGTL